MNRLVFIVFFIFILFTVNGQNTNPQPEDINKVLKFTNDNFNMGNIAYGKPSEFTVDMLNISSSPIVFENVMVSCGCTTPKYTKGVSILPGAHAKLILGFNGIAVGSFSKSATLFFSGGLIKNVTFFGVGVQ
jgi:hypothetical protein